MTPSTETRDWISRQLDPLVDQAGVAVQSDFDLSPDYAGDAEASLTEASVLVGLIERAEGYSVLLTRRSDTLRRHTGQVALPGGRRDPGETAWSTAIREAHEEVGLHPDFVTLAGLSSPYRTGTGYLITPVVAFIETGFSLMATPDEVADIFETPFAFLMDPANHELHERKAPSGETRRFYAMTHDDHYIWGATAGVLRALYDRLYGGVLA